MREVKIIGNKSLILGNAWDFKYYKIIKVLCSSGKFSASRDFVWYTKVYSACRIASDAPDVQSIFVEWMKEKTVGLFLFFSWSVVDLQCYVRFKCTVKWFSYTYKYPHIFFFSDSFPL